MANYANLIAAMAAVIKTNGQQDITGNKLQQQLRSIIGLLGAGYQFGGIVTPTKPLPQDFGDYRVFFLACMAGTYTNYGGVTLDGKGWHLLIYGATWEDVDLHIYVGDLVALKDGYYAGMSVGTADNLVGRGSVEAEYQGIRTSAGKEDIGNGSALIREPQGKSIVWNQLVTIPSSDMSKTESNVTITDNRDGSYTIQTTSEGASANVALSLGCVIVKDHKYAPIGASLRLSDPMYFAVSDSFFDISGELLIAKVSQSVSWPRLTIKSGTIITTPITIWPMMVDLTLEYGEGKEPTLEEWRSRFPLPYYAYNNGTIVNNEATGIKTVGFNLYNPATGKAVLPGKYSDYPYEYEICGAFTALSFEDYAGNVSTPELHDGRFFNVPAPGVLTVTGGNATDTLVHLVWSGWRNQGEPDYTFEPYWENILALNLKTITGKAAGSETSEVIFPDGMRSAGSAYDYLIVDADGYARKAVKAVESVDMGTLTWVKNTLYGNVFNVNITDKRAVSGYGESNLVCSKYVAVYRNNYAGLSAFNKIIAEVRTNSPSSNIAISDADFADKTDEQVKTLLSGVMLNFELATPVVYTLDEPIYLGYPVDDFGTEAKLPVDTATLPTGPVRYSVLYPMNAVDAIRRLPVNYISKDSMDNFTTELASKLGAALGKTITITATYNTSTSAYDYDVTIEDAAPENSNEATE